MSDRHIIETVEELETYARNGVVVFERAYWKIFQGTVIAWQFRGSKWYAAGPYEGGVDTQRLWLTSPTGFELLRDPDE